MILVSLGIYPVAACDSAFLGSDSLSAAGVGLHCVSASRMSACCNRHNAHLWSPCTRQPIVNNPWDSSHDGSASSIGTTIVIAGRGLIACELRSCVCASAVPHGCAQS